MASILSNMVQQTPAKQCSIFHQLHFDGGAWWEHLASQRQPVSAPFSVDGGPGLMCFWFFGNMLDS